MLIKSRLSLCLRKPTTQTRRQIDNTESKILRKILSIISKNKYCNIVKYKTDVQYNFTVYNV